MVSETPELPLSQKLTLFVHLQDCNVIDRNPNQILLLEYQFLEKVRNIGYQWQRLF